MKVFGVKTPVKPRSRHNKRADCMWPILHLSEWMKTAFTDPYNGFFLLGGKRLPDDLHAVHEMLSQFWERHQFVDGRCTAPKEPRCTIPYFIHGDEGRGQVKRPILVVSFQPLFSWGGEQTLNLGKILVPIEFFPCILCTSDL